MMSLRMYKVPPDLSNFAALLKIPTSTYAPYPAGLSVVTLFIDNQAPSPPPFDLGYQASSYYQEWEEYQIHQFVDAFWYAHSIGWCNRTCCWWFATGALVGRIRVVDTHTRRLISLYNQFCRKLNYSHLWSEE